MSVGTLAVIALASLLGCTTTQETVSPLDKLEGTDESLRGQVTSRYTFGEPLKVTKARAALDKLERTDEKLRGLVVMRHISGEASPARVTALPSGKYRFGMWTVDVNNKTYEASPFMTWDEVKKTWLTETYEGTFSVGADGQWHASKPTILKRRVD